MSAATGAADELAEVTAGAIVVASASVIEPEPVDRVTLVPGEGVVAEVLQVESVEQIIPPPKVTLSAPVGGPGGTVTVPIEPLGDGIVNLLADTVGQVVRTARRATGAARVATRNRPATALRQGVQGGVQEAMTGVGTFVQHGADIMTGLFACLRESVYCMGKVIRQPSQRPCRQRPTPHQTAARTT
ncbi:MAG: hypothetical protein H7838_10550 [Magnetococcus sp. DMHC-8]